MDSAKNILSEEDEVDPIDRVEHYLNIKEHRHTILKSGIECNCPAASERSFRLTTSNGAGIPYIPYTRISKVKKEAVNIDLIVLKVSLVCSIVCSSIRLLTRYLSLPLH